MTAPKTGRPGDTLTEDEVRQVARLIETLNGSTFDYLQLELGELKLTIAKGGSALPGMSAGAHAPAPAPAGAVPASAAAVPAPAAPTTAAAPASVDDGTVAITAPMIGRFYSQSEPGAAPYVTVGAQVDASSTVGLVEAMKMFNAVHAGVKGTITQILVQDATLVEYGQVLFRVKPD